ncbi:serine/threonine-protein kinase PLK1-like isoform X1 [Oncorhynchus mykiss]|uniref:serine/threonine-protein kinase PLK1-like n=1 Tax=Oncorhynchus clarkii lewisi TaxID=490388 RepID=UPI001878BDE8|nr:serine/threonine-protein kinase PLK1 isoform X1 [Oncorhynchus mykiss]XP_036829267.1 serine/threonine-protein kinase PLK1-like isoform X1 [Oncorhynchus mykiss]
MSAPVAKAVNPSTNVDPKSAPLKDIPDILVDPRTLKKYSRGRFLGKGGFAKCYEITDMETKEVFAGKVVPKSMIVKPHQREKMSSEISIHKSLDNPHIVGFHGFFEDDDFVFVVLEICRRRSLLELHKRRKAVTEPEARYYMMQLVKGCQYLHNNRVIHRDLKLGNIFLSDDMDVKIGDFGLATTIEFDGERKKTLCGTPNYIAPEVLCKKGHSFEVDVWSLGCILYTLLVGKPPFETSCLKETYNRIKKNNYTIPWQINPVAASLIKRMLHADPSQRPTVSQLLTDEFFTEGYIPLRLPTTCLTVPPRFSIAPSSLEPSQRRPLTALNNKAGTEKVEQKDEPLLREIPEATDCHLSDLLQQLDTCNAAKPSERGLIRMEEAEDPACVPIFWISKWVDYSDKYGLGYQLCDNSVGVLFNDCTRMIMYADGDSLQYIDKMAAESYLSVRSYPATLSKKITLLKYFRNYMSEHLLKAGANITPRDGDELARLPYLSHWFRTKSAIVLHLTNGTVQINFFQDHTKLILCPLMGAVSFIDEKRDFRTYKMSLIEEFGCCKELASRMRYARLMVAKLLSCKSSTPH